MEKKNQVPKYPPLRFPEFTDEWNEVTLGEVAEIRGRIGYRGYRTEDLVAKECGALVIGGKHISQNRLDLSDPDYLSWAKFLESPEIAIEEDDIIIAQRGTLGRSALVKYDIGKATINPSVLILRHKLVNARFLHYTLLKDDSISYVMRCASKTSIPMISQKQLGDMPIYQASLEEQEKIASFLSLIDERIEVQNAIIKEREAQKAALLRRLFDRTLRFPEFTDEWKKVKLGEVAEIIGGGTPSTTTTNYWDGEIVWFNPSEIGKKKYVSNSNRTISFQGLSNSGARLLPKGTVLLTTRATIGEIAIANVECTTNQGFQSVVTGHEANNEYVYYFLSTQKVYLLRHSSGSTFLETPSSVIRNLPLRLPSLPEQKKIAALLSAIDERLDVERAYAEQLKLQKAYLLRQMFI